MGTPKGKKDVLSKKVAKALKKKGAKIEYLSEEGGEVIFSTSNSKIKRTAEGIRVRRKEFAELTQVPTYFQIIDEDGKKISGGQVHLICGDPIPVLTVFEPTVNPGDLTFNIAKFSIAKL